MRMLPAWEVFVPFELVGPSPTGHETIIGAIRLGLTREMAADYMVLRGEADGVMLMGYRRSRVASDTADVDSHSQRA